MITEAQRRFDIDYHYIRRELIRGRSDVDMIKSWIKVRGDSTAVTAEREVIVLTTADIFKRQSWGETAELKALDMKDDEYE